MRWPVFYIVLAASGFVLPGLADHLSRARDATLEQQIATRIPDQLTIRFGATIFSCDSIPASKPTYQCAVEVP